MTDALPGARDRVGPVLRHAQATQAVLDAILELNPGAELLDRGSYVRVLAPGPCVLTKLTIEKYAARKIVFPAELEAIMPSFKGLLTIDEERAVWDFHR